MSIITKSGRIAIAESIKLRACHIAWGPGDGAWTTPPKEEPTDSTITNEIGRRLATEIAFVVKDDNGDIKVASGNYSRTATPGNLVLFRTQFQFTDAPNAVIRQVGVFLGTVPLAGLPAGQQYFVPADLQSPGRLLELNNIPPMFRSPEIRPTINVVVAF